MGEPTEPTSQLSDAIARQEAALTLQLDWVRAVDGKTPTVIGLATAMLTALGLAAPERADMTWLSILLLAVGSAPLLACLGYCVRATFPHTDGPAGSFIYFGGIADLALSQYSEKVKTRTAEEHLADLSRQVHRNAQIASAKYNAVQKAMRWLFIGTPLWLVIAYFLYKG